ncbi:hypothetical protein [Hymenobacter rigui]|uniref:Uncharacterized protein n=1 Tax=Hymenobacter rigui TaxID=334424 RepID=A0A3R9P4M7_9BACT|nr:hypothetical protein [Hymenobacter rigui]RSK50059.1 hypothetical protein EI291_05255 [Hymenobacter rigui]
MPSPLRRDYLIASCLYSVFVALYLLPTFYLYLPEPLGPARHADASFEQIIGPVLLAILLPLAALIGLGLGIRAGKTWAKGIYLLLFAYAMYVFVRAFPFFLERSAWTMTKESVALALLLGAAFFLFRQQLTRRAAPAEADTSIIK